MFKKITLVVLTLVMVLAFVVSPAMAASQEARVVIGADNNDEQIGAVSVSYTHLCDSIRKL